MTSQPIELVRNTFALLAPRADEVAGLFYDRLFDQEPSLRALFHGDLSAQGRKLMQTIGVAVAALDRIDTLLPKLHEPGRRHAAYGVENRHYDVVGAVLMSTFREGLGAAFTPHVGESWGRRVRHGGRCDEVGHEFRCACRTFRRSSGALRAFATAAKKPPARQCDLI
ncbi:MAG TPA: globin domain-containing protein [Casimicrobiaceae bacterium]